jgi:hypothetical protein
MPAGAFMHGWPICLQNRQMPAACLLGILLPFFLSLCAGHRLVAEAGAREGEV